MKIPMIARFSLYGFLKNQRYFEPFLVLVFLEKGLSFFWIGVLVAFRELCVNLIEIPSGAIAEVYGRRAGMLISFSAYIVSFVVFASADDLRWFFGAMFWFAVGEAFRTGTHKAMIFEWLRLQGREDERTKVYGYTRSWSKMGSAVSVLLAALWVVLADGYSMVFWASIVPYVLSIFNLLSYPRELDGERKEKASIRAVWENLREAFAAALRPGKGRRLILESMGFEGTFHTVKDYLQPALQTLALAGVFGSLVDEFSPVQQTALLIAPVYFVIFVMASQASRQAHRLVDLPRRQDDDQAEERAARWIWAMVVFFYAGMAFAAGGRNMTGLAVFFLFLYMLQNMWRPILISRFDALGKIGQGATVLSIESQSRRLAVMVLAPLVGWTVDASRIAGATGGRELWPLGVLGMIVAFGFLYAGDLRERREDRERRV